MVVVAIQRTRNGQLASAEGATLQVYSSTGASFFGPVVVAPTSIGTYSYELNTITPGNWTAVWTFTNTGYSDDIISRPFSVDFPTAITEGVTLAELERLVARRVGPYRAVTVTAPTVLGGGSTVQRLYSRSLKSSLDLGSYEDQFMLRRGLNSDGGLIPGFFYTDDRVRQIVSYDAANGWLMNDQDWLLAPDDGAGEQVEIHYLDPEHELRPAVLDGLKRCFFWDEIRIAVESGAAAYNVNMSAVAPWLLTNAQIKTAGFYYPSQTTPPTPLSWWEPYRYGGSVYLRSEGGFVGSLVIGVLRPVSSFVNGENSINGPDDDLDVLSVDPDYAAWAGVLEVWKSYPERIQPLANAELRPSRKEAAAEFTKKSLMIAQQAPPESPVMRLNYGAGRGLGGTVIGNLAETP